MEEQRRLLFNCTTTRLGPRLAKALGDRDPRARPSKGLGPALRFFSERGLQYKLYAGSWKTERQVEQLHKNPGCRGWGRQSDPRRSPRSTTRCSTARCSIATGRRPHRNSIGYRFKQNREVVVKPGFEPAVNSRTSKVVNHQTIVPVHVRKRHRH